MTTDDVRELRADLARWKASWACERDALKAELKAAAHSLACWRELAALLTAADATHHPEEGDPEINWGKLNPRFRELLSQLGLKVDWWRSELRCPNPKENP